MNQFKRMAYPYVAWIAVMILAPMLMIVMYAFIEKGNDVTTFRFTISNFTKFFSDKVYIDVLYRSLYVAILTTIICLLIGYPTAYIIPRAKPKHRTWLVLMITFPTWINMLVRTYAWLGILQDNGIVNTILGLFGIGTVKIIYTNFAVILGMVYNFVPFMILQIYSSLEKMDKSYIEAASDLGANKYQCFWRITFPMSLPGVISGISIKLLYTEAARRRSVCAYRKRNRNTVPYSRKLELRKCNIAYHGNHNYDFALYNKKAGH